MTTEEKRIDKNSNFNKLISGIMDIPTKKTDEGIKLLYYCIK